MKKPQLVILAGPNGAGKSTYQDSQSYLKKLPFINADKIALATYKRQPETEAESQNAQGIARDVFRAYVDNGKSFCFETVFSHKSKLEQIKEAITHGYSVHLIVICNKDSAVNIARVKQRFANGGHDVPEDKVVSRISRTLPLLNQALPYVSSFQLFDSSLLEGKSECLFTEIAVKKKSRKRVKLLQSPLPDWANTALGAFPVHHKR